MSHGKGKASPDPAFPERPVHEDFWKLSEAAIENDNLGGRDGKGFRKRVEHFVDQESLDYLVWQRAGVLTEDPRLRASFAAAMVDGFTLGCSYMEKKH